MSTYLFSIICSLFLAFTLVVFQTCLVISLIDKLFCGINKNRIATLTPSQKSLQFFAIMAFGCIAFGGLCLVILRINDLSIHNITDYYSTIHMILHSLFMIFMSLAFLFAYFFMVCRLIATFEDSIYQVHKVIIIIYISIAIISVLLGFILIAMVKLNVFDAVTLNIWFAIMIILPISAVIHLIYSFNYRLFQLVLVQRESTSLNVDGFGLSDDQITILSIVRKHTVLGISLILLAFVALINYGLAVIIYSMSPNNLHYLTLSTYLNSTGYIVIFDIINVISLNMASLCIYLGFTVNRYYYKSICHLVDHKCQKICQSMAQNQIERNKYQNVKPMDVVDTAHENSEIHETEMYETSDLR